MKAPHRAQHHGQQHHAVGKAAKPPGPVQFSGGAMATGGKGTPTSKHHAPAHRKHQPKKARKWTPDGDVALCSARAFAESLRLSGRGAVSDSELLDVYWATAPDADTGASILATAAAIFSRGLGGHYPLGMEAGSALPLSYRHAKSGPGLEPGDLFPPRALRTAVPQSLILGLDLPGGESHAVTVGPDGTWWSWGEPFDPADWPGAVVEEAWAVTWP